MRIADNWTEYRIIDTTSQEKLESWNGILLIRPDPQIIWKTSHKSPLWDRARDIITDLRPEEESGALPKNRRNHGRYLTGN